MLDQVQGYPEVAPQQQNAEENRGDHTHYQNGHTIHSVV